MLIPTRPPRDDLFLRCLVLAALVHVWLALTIGTRPGPTLPGSGGWGDLAITLQGVGDGAGAAEGEAPAPVWRDDGPLGEAKHSRHGGRVRATAPPLDTGPGAQRQGRWQSQEVAEAPDRPDDESSGPRGAPEAPATANPAADASPAPTAPRTLAADAAPRAALAPAPALAGLTPSALPELAPMTPTVDLPDPLLNTLVEPRAPPSQHRSSQDLQAPSIRLNDAPLRPSTAQLELPADAPSLRSLETPLPLRAMARSDGPLAAPKPSAAPPALAPVQAKVELPPDEPVLKSFSAAPQAQARPRAALAVDALKPSAASATDLAAVAAQVDLPAPDPVLKTLSGGTAAPRRLPREPLPRAPLDLAAQRQEATALRPLEPLALAPVGEGAGTAAPAARGDPVPEPTPGPRLAAGSPDAGAQVGHDVATAPSAAASAPPRPLNLSLPRANGPTARPSQGLLALLPAVPDTKSKLEKSIEEAQREDCRKAHADKGLLGALPLALDSARGKGCKW